MRIVETTPTIVRHGPACVPLPVTARKRRPSALSAPKCFRANAVLTIATGWRVSRSLSVNARPSSRRCPVAAK
jgi:hypothetical protein